MLKSRGWLELECTGAKSEVSTVEQEMQCLPLKDKKKFQ